MRQQHKAVLPPKRKEQWVGNLESALASAPHSAAQVQHTTFGWTSKKQETLNLHPRDEGSRGTTKPLLGPAEDSSEDSIAHERPNRRSGFGACCRLCALFLVVFLVSSTLGGFAFFLLCRQGYTEPAKQLNDLPVTQPGNDQGVGWWSMPEQQPLISLQQAKKSLYKQQTRLLAGMNMSFGVAQGNTAPSLMFSTTRVARVAEQVPEKLRGVFWVQDGGRQELMVLQYSRWIEESSLLVVPTAPFSYAWAAGRRASPDVDKGFYYYPEDAQLRSVDAILSGSAHSFRFSGCAPGAGCTQGDVLAFADVQVHPTGSTKVARSPNALHEGSTLSFLSGFWKGSQSLREEASDVPGTRWRTVEKWGLLGCDCLQHRTSTIEKIVDGSGEPIEPQYSEFMRIAGGDPFYFWTGWPGEDERAMAQQKLSALSMVGMS